MAWHCGFDSYSPPRVFPCGLCPSPRKATSTVSHRAFSFMNGRMQAWRAWAAPSPQSLSPGERSFSGEGAPILHWSKSMTMLVYFACER